MIPHATRHTPAMDREAAPYLRGDTNWRRDLRPGPRDGLTTRRELDRLLDNGIRALSDATGGKIPHNLGTHGTPLSGQCWRCQGAFDRDIMVHYARAGGWLQEAATLPGLVRMIIASTSPSGENSPRTHIDWVALAFSATHPRHPDGGISPGRLLRRIYAIQRKAAQILGTTHSARWIAPWRAVDLALIAGCTRRAAMILAARKLAISDAWHPGIDLSHPTTGHHWTMVCHAITTYRQARATVAVALAADPARVIESDLLHPAWRESAYLHVSRALTAAIDPVWDLAA